MLVRLSRQIHDRMRVHLNAEPTEQVGFLFMRGTADEMTVEDYHGVPRADLVDPSPFHAEVAEEAQARILMEASRRQLCLGEVHSHPRSTSGTAFSGSDLSGFSEFVPHVFWRTRQHAYAAFVFGVDEFDSLAWRDSSRAPSGSATIDVGGRLIKPTGLTWKALEARARSTRERFIRQELLFGREGQAALHGTSVGVVGLGGLGVHVVQQLAYLGIGRFVLVDADLCDQTNLNRLIGATETDIGRSKAVIAERLIRAIAPEAGVSAVETAFPSALSQASLASCSVIFGCVDNDRARLALLDYCCQRRIPYLDLATDAENGFGGRLVFSGIGAGCLFCLGELDQKEMWHTGSTEAQRNEDRRIYGVSSSALDSSGPAVISINGVVASLAVTEFLAFVTGLRIPQPYLNYRGGLGIVTRGERPGLSHCYYCEDRWNESACGLDVRA
jgi:molybdopterin/thiamine biosynthesis adenylyltransferase